jgi:hypothetical protein
MDPHQPEAAVEPAGPAAPILAADLTHLARVLIVLSQDLAKGKRKRGTIGCVPPFPICFDRAAKSQDSRQERMDPSRHT